MQGKKGNSSSIHLKLYLKKKRVNVAAEIGKKKGDAITNKATRTKSSEKESSRMKGQYSLGQ